MTSPDNALGHFSMPHILVVDDDARIRNLVGRYLLDHGFIVVKAADASEAREMLDTLDLDLAVVDVMMPGETGLELTKSLQGKIPIILLTALGEIDDRLNGFDAGADDYLPKPFEPQELVMRIKALLRRTMKKQQGQAEYRFGKLRYNALEQRLFDDGLDEFVALTETEASLLKVLCQKIGQVCSRAELAKACNIPSDRAVDVQITRLRRKLEVDTKNPVYLQTLRGKGYLLRADNMDGQVA